MVNPIQRINRDFPDRETTDWKSIQDANEERLRLVRETAEKRAFRRGQAVATYEEGREKAERARAMGGDPDSPEVEELDLDAYYKQALESFGLPGLWEQVEIETTPDTTIEMVWAAARETDIYKKTFAGNEGRLQKGLTALPEEEYLATRNSYKKALQAFGVSATELFRDKTGESVDEDEAFSQLIGQDVSPAEFAQRLRIADEWTQSADPATKEALRTFYGVSDNELRAYALNPEGGQAVLQRRAAEVQAASQAIESGFDLFSTTTSRPGDELGREFLGDLATRGLPKDATPQEIDRQTRVAEEAIARAGEQRPTFERLSDISGADLTAEEQVESQIADITGMRAGSDARARGKMQRLRSQERARFEGGSGGTNIFGDNESGSF